MVLGLIGAVAAVPAIVGTVEAIRMGQRQNAREEHRGRKSNLKVYLSAKDEWSSQFDGAKVVLVNHKLYIDLSTIQLEKRYKAHPFNGYYLPHPQNQSKWKGEGWKGEGMVTTISDSPPLLNWVYVDSNTHEVKYGTRAETAGHYTGPWDCTEQDKRVTFQGWEGFIAAKESDDADLWGLYFDINNDGLSTQERIGTSGRTMLYVELWRSEKKRSKETADAEREERVKANAEKERQENERLEREMAERDKDRATAYEETVD